jgi:hypothetical protein
VTVSAIRKNRGLAMNFAAAMTAAATGASEVVLSERLAAPSLRATKDDASVWFVLVDVIGDRHRNSRFASTELNPIDITNDKGGVGASADDKDRGVCQRAMKQHDGGAVSRYVRCSVSAPTLFSIVLRYIQYIDEYLHCWLLSVVACGLLFNPCCWPAEF